MKKSARRILVLFLILTMSVSMIPVASFADEAFEEVPEELVIAEKTESELEEQTVLIESEEIQPDIVEIEPEFTDEAGIPIEENLTEESEPVDTVPAEDVYEEVTAEEGVEPQPEFPDEYTEATESLEEIFIEPAEEAYSISEEETSEEENSEILEEEEAETPEIPLEDISFLTVEDNSETEITGEQSYYRFTAAETLPFSFFLKNSEENMLFVYDETEKIWIETEGNFFFKECEAGETLYFQTECTVLPDAFCVLQGINETEELNVSYMGFEYKYDYNSGTVSIIGYSSSSSNVVIPCSIGGYSVSEISKEAFKGKTNIVSVKIPESVHVIGENAFSDCTGLTKIQFDHTAALGDYLNIGKGAFRCSNEIETYVTIPNASDINIDIYDYPWDESNRNVWFSASDEIFWNYDGTNLCIKGSGAIPDAPNAYSNTWSVLWDKPLDLYVENGITSLGSYSFANFLNIKSINLASSVKEIHDACFWISDDMKDVGVGLTSVSGSGVQTIRYAAFENREYLKDISFPVLNTIYDDAFCNCGLETFTVPATLEHLYPAAFQECDSLSSFIAEGNDRFRTACDGTLLLAWNDSFNGYAVAASVNTYNIPNVYGYIIPDSVVYLYPYAFDESYLQYVVIPASVRCIDSHAFNNCDILNEVVFLHDSSDNLEICDKAFTSEKAINTSVYVPDAVNCNSAIKGYKWSSDNRAVNYADFVVFELSAEYLLLDSDPGSENSTASVSLHSKENSSVISILGYADSFLSDTNVSWQLFERTASGETKACSILEFENGIQTGPEITIKAKENVEGTGYLKVTYKSGEREYSRECRIDVTENLLRSGNILGVNLPNNSAVVELYKTDYTKVEVVIDLLQNQAQFMSSNASDDEDSGIAIDSAKFVNSNGAESDSNYYFELRVADDRYLEIVPTSLAVSRNKITDAEYTPSNICVTIAGKEYITNEKLNLSFKYTKPTVKVTKPLPFNSFYEYGTNDYKMGTELTFTNGNVVSVRKNPGKSPEWVDVLGSQIYLKNEEVSLKGSASGTLYAFLTVEGYAVEQEVAIPVSYKYTAPSLKLNSTQILIPDAVKVNHSLDYSGPDSSVYIAGDEIIYYILAGNKTTDIGSIESITLPMEGNNVNYQYIIKDFNVNSEYNGNKACKINLRRAESAFPAKQGDLVTLRINFEHSREYTELTLKVSVPTKIQLKADIPNNSVFNVSLCNSFTFNISTSCNYDFYKLGKAYEDSIPVSLVDSKGRDSFNYYVALNTEDYVDYVSVTLSFKYDFLRLSDDTYTLTMWYHDMDSRLNNVVVKFKVVSESAKITAKVKKVSGSIDLTKIPKNGIEDSIILSVDYTNYRPDENDDWGIWLEQRDKKTGNVINQNVLGSLFYFKDRIDNCSIFFEISPNYSNIDQVDIEHYNYFFVFYSWTTRCEAQMKFPVTRSAVSMKLNASQVAFAYGKKDSAYVVATASQKNLCAFNPVIECSNKNLEVSEREIYQTQNGSLAVAFKISSSGVISPGEYQVKISAGEQYKPSILKVTVSPNPVGSSIKAKGTIDVIRDTTCITVDATYKNYSGYLGGRGEYEETRQFTFMRNGVPLSTEKVPFDVSWSYDGKSAEITMKPEAVINTATEKYSAYLITSLQGSGTTKTQVQSNIVNLNLKMGSGKAISNKKEVALATQDKNESAIIKISGTDSSVNNVRSVAIAPKQKLTINKITYAMEDLLDVIQIDDNYYAIRFRNGKRVPVAVTTNVKLNVFFAGNNTISPKNGEKTANATVSVKVTLLP